MSPFIVSEYGMDSQEFVDTLRIVVGDGAVSDVLNSLKNPPGRRPSEDLQERSTWFNSLDENKRRILSGILQDAVGQTIFGVLCVLDGVRAIENAPNKGKLELRYVNDGSVLLNPPEGKMLHDLW
jgi:hypothetical protein